MLHWPARPSWLAGVALSTTSVAVVYAVMLELGLNTTPFGKAILAACFVNDLGTVIALGLIFAPFTVRTAVFVGVSVIVFAVLPWLTPRFFKRYGGRVSELEAKYLLLLLFGMGGLATWSGSEAVLPAYVIGVVLAGTVGKDHVLIRRLRTLTFGLLTPFYFIRAESCVSVPALVAAPFAFLVLFGAKSVSKFVGVFPVAKLFRYGKQEAIYTTLLMSTGLTFGTISALFGLSHGIIDQAQYSYLVAAVIASAVIPTVIANAFFLSASPPPHDDFGAGKRRPWRSLAGSKEARHEDDSRRIRRVRAVPQGVRTRAGYCVEVPSQAGRCQCDSASRTGNLRRDRRLARRRQDAVRGGIRAPGDGGCWSRGSRSSRKWSSATPRSQRSSRRGSSRGSDCHGPSRSKTQVTRWILGSVSERVFALCALSRNGREVADGPANLCAPTEPVRVCLLRSNASAAASIGACDAIPSFMSSTSSTMTSVARGRALTPRTSRALTSRCSCDSSTPRTSGKAGGSAEA